MEAHGAFVEALASLPKFSRGAVLATCNPADHGYTTESLAALLWCCSLRLQVTWPFEYMDSSPWGHEWKQQGKRLKSTMGTPCHSPPLVNDSTLPQLPAVSTPINSTESITAGRAAVIESSCQPLVKH